MSFDLTVVAWFAMYISSVVVVVVVVVWTGLRLRVPDYASRTTRPGLRIPEYLSLTVPQSDMGVRFYALTLSAPQNSR
jgi:hypothetical protein